MAGRKGNFTLTPGPTLPLIKHGVRVVNAFQAGLGVLQLLGDLSDFFVAITVPIIVELYLHGDHGSQPKSMSDPSQVHPTLSNCT